MAEVEYDPAAKPSVVFDDATYEAEFSLVGFDGGQCPENVDNQGRLVTDGGWRHGQPDDPAVERAY